MLMIPGGISLFRDRSAAIALLEQYDMIPGFKKHCLATGAGMKSLAAHLGEDEAVRETTGLLPDIDFELVRGDMQLHGEKGAEILEGAGYRSRSGPDCSAAQSPSLFGNLRKTGRDCASGCRQCIRPRDCVRACKRGQTF